MGYTHYFEKVKQPTAEQWNAFLLGAKKVVGDQRRILCGMDDGPPEITEAHVWINGIGDDGHEDFVVRFQAPIGFGFCKTARKPYDTAVTALLCLLDHHCEGCYQISSDGSYKEWGPGRQLCVDLQLPYACPIGLTDS